MAAGSSAKQASFEAVMMAKRPRLRYGAPFRFSTECLADIRCDYLLFITPDLNPSRPIGTWVFSLLSCSRSLSPPSVPHRKREGGHDTRSTGLDRSATSLPNFGPLK